jgi:hypothetical protein
VKPQGWRSEGTEIGAGPGISHEVSKDWLTAVASAVPAEAEAAMPSLRQPPRQINQPRATVWRPPSALWCPRRGRGNLGSRRRDLTREHSHVGGHPEAHHCPRLKENPRL